MVIGVARILIPGDKTIFAPSPTKNAEFEEKSRRAQKRERGKALHLLFVTSVYFFEIIK